MPNVDLIYDADCPNVSVARANLMRAFSVAGIHPKWSEHRIGDPGTPEYTRGYGSPTVLVDGRDVAGLEPSEEVCCRIYSGVTGSAQAPSVEQIAEAMTLSATGTSSGGGGLDEPTRIPPRCAPP